MDDIKINYQFITRKNIFQKYELTFDRSSMKLRQQNQNPSEWTRLEHKKCSNCPLNAKDHPHCPVAKNLDYIATQFAQEKSFATCTISVTTEERTYLKKASLQEGLQGIFGLIMATSGCPHLDFLRPQARFHLPFANYLETVIRTTSFYLLKQFFNLKDGRPADFDLKGLDAKYDELAKVNLGILGRIGVIANGDADSNALVILDGFASLLKIVISNDLTVVRKAIEA